MTDLCLYDHRITNIEYSRLPGFAPNSEPHFLKAIADGFDGLKADLRLTKDGEIVLCHDAGYTLNAAGQITDFDPDHYIAIHDLRLEQILSLRFDTGLFRDACGPITLDRMLSLCREHQMIPYLTNRHESWCGATAQRMAELLDKYDLRSTAIMNLYPGNKVTLKAITDACGPMIACDTKMENDVFSEQMIDESCDDGYKIICLCHYSKAPVTRELIEYANGKGINIWEWGMTTEEEVRYYLKMGVNGFQMYTRSVNNCVITNILSGI